MKIEFALEDINDVARTLLNHFPLSRCFAFYAEMGRGKTTLIKALCTCLGVTENTSSPTFSIINEYRGSQDCRIFHSDWYRLKGVQDAIDAGVEDVLQTPGAYHFIEWPEVANELLPSEFVRVTLTLGDGQKRILTAELFQAEK